MNSYYTAIGGILKGFRKLSITASQNRDFDVGTSEAENVDNYMNKCWKVVVIMSNEFAKSDWCQWEVDFVQQRRRKKGKESFILIMLKSFESSS
jgi:toll-like receptor 13